MVIIRGLMVKLSRVVKWVVCTTCRGLLVKDRLGAFGACRTFVFRLVTFVRGLMNLSEGSCMVTVPMAKLSCVRLLVSDALKSIAGPCELMLQLLV